MILLYVLLIQKTFSQCFQKKHQENIYLSPNETIKLDLQDYLYGKQLSYTINNKSLSNCIDQKLKILNFSLTNIISDYSGYSLCLDSISGASLGQATMFQVKSTTLTVSFYNISDGTLSFVKIIKINKVTNKEIIKNQNYNCENIICLRENEVLIDCRSYQLEQQYFIIVNATTQEYHQILIQNQDYGKILGYIDENEIYHIYKLIDDEIETSPNDHLDHYKINITENTTIQETIINKTIYNTNELILYDFKLYNNAIYVLSYQKGLCIYKLQNIEQLCWNLDTQFDIFNVFIEQDGTHSVILSQSISYEVYKANLYDDFSYKIVTLFNIKQGQKVKSIYSNQKYTIILTHPVNNFKKETLEIYDQLSDQTYNLYYSIEKIFEPQIFYFDPMRGEINIINNKSISLTAIQISYLTIDWNNCFADTFFIIGQYQQNLEIEYTCNITFNVEKLEKNSQQLWEIGEMNQIINVLNKSINTFYLNGYIVGPNVNYYLNKQQNLMEQDDDDQENIKFKKHYSITYNQTVDSDRILFSQILYKESEETTLKYSQIIQFSDYSLFLFTCNLQSSDSSQITCNYTINLQLISITQIQQIITNINCQLNCIAIRQNQLVTLYFEENYVITDINCKFEFNTAITIIQLYQEVYLFFLIDNVIEAYKIIYYQGTICQQIKVIEINLTQLNNLINYDQTINNVFTIITNLNSYYLYISTNLGIIVIDPGLIRFQQIQLITFIQFSQQFNSILQVIDNKLIYLNHTIINVLSISQSTTYYQDKQLPLYNFSITNTTNSQISQDQSLLFIEAKDENEKTIILVYDLDKSQTASLITTFQKSNNQIFNVISFQKTEIIVEVFDANQLFINVELLLKKSQNEIIQVIFEGFNQIQKTMNINVNVTTSEQLYNLTLNLTDKVNIEYTSRSDKYIYLKEFNEYIIGSVSQWNMTGRDCPRDFQLINNINFNTNLSQISSAIQIKHTYDYVFIQQEQSILAIDGNGKVKFLVELPIPESHIKCSAIAASVQNQKTKLVISVCNSTAQASFYLTSFLGSFPTPMGPFYSPILINQITHLRMLDNFLFILDAITDYVYIFDLTITSLDSEKLKIVRVLNAREFTADINQVFISFDVAFLNNTYTLFLITSSSNLIVYEYYNYNEPDFSVSYDIIKFIFSIGYTDIPSNIVAQSLHISNYSQSNNILYYTFIITNQNYHHYELKIIYTENENNEIQRELQFVRAYMQYGYYQANGKIRVSEDTQGFFGVIYQNPLDEKQKVLTIYDRNQANFENLTKILGGYKIYSANQVLFDFLHYSNKYDEFSYGIILQEGDMIQSLTLSHYLAIKINDVEFTSQNLTFNASNDFGKSVKFSANIYNASGQGNLTIIIIILIALVFIIGLGSFMYIKNKLKKQNSIYPSEIQEYNSLISNN